MNTRSIRAFALAAVLGAAGTAFGQTVVVDVGSDNSFRGASVVNPPAAGNDGIFRNSVDQLAFFGDLLDIDGNPTTVDYGIVSLTGTDYFNGPSADVQDPAASVYDAAALGPLLGNDELVYDWQANPQWTIQGLDPTKVYDITLYAARKFASNSVTRFSVYTDATFTMLDSNVTPVDLDHGTAGDHNETMTALLASVAPDMNGIIHLEASGADGANGYLNGFVVEVVPPVMFNAQPISAITDAGGTLNFAVSFSSDDPMATVRWQKDGIDLADDTRISGSQTASLSIAQASLDDVASYTAVVTADGGDVSSDPAVGAVRGSPLGIADFDNDGTLTFFDVLAFLTTYDAAANP